MLRVRPPTAKGWSSSLHCSLVHVIFHLCSMYTSTTIYATPLLPTTSPTGGAEMTLVGSTTTGPATATPTPLVAATTTTRLCHDPTRHGKHAKRSRQAAVAEKRQVDQQVSPINSTWVASGKTPLSMEEHQLALRTKAEAAAGEKEQPPKKTRREDPEAYRL